MFLQRSAVAVVRRAAVAAPALRRGLATTAIRRQEKKDEVAASAAKAPEKKYKTLSEVKDWEDLFGPGAEPGTVPTDLEQATGLERLELLGKMEGVDIFDMRPLDASRRSTIEDPIMVRSAGHEQYAGCTGFPAGSHTPLWQVLSRDRPVSRCDECGQVYKMMYVGPDEDEHGHGHDGHGHEPYDEPKTFAHYVRPEYKDGR